MQSKTDPEEPLPSKSLGVVEFYSGIGGWHYAIRETGLNLKILAAVDINTTANQVYKHNFPNTKVLQRNILGLSAQELDSFLANLFTLSPPCQPFTRQGKNEDDIDYRTDSFFHLMGILSAMQKPPQYIMMENVKGFELSRTRGHFVHVLKELGYTFQEYLISPKQFGIPNSRLRYYLLARLSPRNFKAAPLQDTVEHLKYYIPTSFHDIHLKCDISSYLDDLSEIDVQQFLVPDRILEKYAQGLDIVSAKSHSSCCFTRGYYHYAVGTGSVLHHDCSVDLALAYQCYAEQKNNCDGIKSLKELKLRYFTPQEVAKLMSFPASHTFPTSVSNKQCYKLLGNSVNVFVVATLLCYLCSQ
ncbi:PREDICTED: tRNA (cytosine(38)-C(5))-methyltransferase-like [Amphimedon queenslandica]|nr:PREDICTED: tRNA (cytosine(38)-C(5))-methyltransferase-like [Amphimedon queenslandica]|eukprot:XP_003389338.2 PREDICTED: tRNA (cytosine(38)-C(5))-methyltransferase-like [Amphimedon queenslandica]